MVADGLMRYVSLSSPITFATSTTSLARDFTLHIADNSLFPEYYGRVLHKTAIGQSAVPSYPGKAQSKLLQRSAILDMLSSGKGNIYLFTIRPYATVV
jgi:hypothetical protein